MNSLVCLKDRGLEQDYFCTQFNPEIRIDKVLSMRRQLTEGRYRIAEKLDVVVDRMIEKLLSQ